MREFNSKNDAAVFKKKGIEIGVYKDCSHLKVIGGVVAAIQFHPFKTYCDEHSFQINKNPEYSEGCPKDCLLFKDRIASENELARQKRNERMRETTKTWLGTPFAWFAKLPATTQGLIIILLIVLFLPKLALTILTIAKALK